MRLNSKNLIDSRQPAKENLMLADILQRQARTGHRQ